MSPPTAAPDDRAFADAQRFLLLAKRYWSTRLTADLRAGFAADDDTAGPGRCQDPTLASTFGWLERHLQRAKYSGRYGLQHWLSRDREQHESDLAEATRQAQARGLLVLDAGLPLPEAFTSVDIHQHPGGVWSDPLAGLVYERGARTTTPMAGERHRDLHERLADRLLACAGPVQSLLDLGCGFGKSTGPLGEALPGARVVGVDIAAPCLTVAAREALARGMAHVQYRQADARRCGEANDSIDVVTSTMLLHEMPAHELAELFAEAWRVLRPGGLMMHLDFLPDVQPGAGPFLRHLHEGHLVRNNEPYMRDLMQTDLHALLSGKGFTDLVIEPFAEAEGMLAPDHPNWRFPWAIVAARKPPRA